MATSTTKPLSRSDAALIAHYVDHGEPVLVRARGREWGVDWSTTDDRGDLYFFSDDGTILDVRECRIKRATLAALRDPDNDPAAQFDPIYPE